MAESLMWSLQTELNKFQETKTGRKDSSAGQDTHLENLQIVQSESTFYGTHKAKEKGGDQRKTRRYDYYEKDVVGALGNDNIYQAWHELVEGQCSIGR